MGCLWREVVVSLVRASSTISSVLRSHLAHVHYFFFVGTKNAVLLAGALAAEVKDGRKREIIDMHLASMQHMCTQSDKDAEKLVTAGAVHTLIHLLKIRAGTGDGLESVLITLGLLACVVFLSILTSITDVLWGRM